MTTSRDVLNKFLTLGTDGFAWLGDRANGSGATAPAARGLASDLLSLAAGMRTPEERIRASLEALANRSALNRDSGVRPHVREILSTTPGAESWTARRMNDEIWERGICPPSEGRTRQIMNELLREQPASRAD